MKALLIAGAMLALSAPLANACPSWENNGQQASFSASQLRGGGQTVEIVAGGDQSVLGCGIPFGSDRGEGYVMRDPDFTFQLSGLSSSKLVLSTFSECDSVLVINTGGANWYYDDDDNAASALDAQIVLSRPGDGIFDIWVGTHDGSYCDAFLKLQTMPR